MKIVVENHQKDLPINKESVRRIVSHFLSLYQIETDEISLHFVMEEKIIELHKRFFNDPTITDCITLPIDSPDTPQPYHLLGEIFICPKTALSYAINHSQDPFEELTLYIIHGLLHLIGYDDIEEKDERIMRKKEKECMESLKKEKLLLSKAL